MQAAYWSLYRVARNYPSLVKLHTWQWYINQAVLTVKRMTDGGVGYTSDGLMDETVFRFLLDDLKREGLTSNATLIESRMQARQGIWAGERYPFVSCFSPLQNSTYTRIDQFWVRDGLGLNWPRRGVRMEQIL